jgi:hypothetical protein
LQDGGKNELAEALLLGVETIGWIEAEIIDFAPTIRCLEGLETPYPETALVRLFDNASYHCAQVVQR